MDEYIVLAPLRMPRGSALRIDDGRGILIGVAEGEVWLTQEGSCKDHIMRAGQYFRLDRDGAAIAHAFRGSELTLTALERGPFARRIVLVAAGTGNASQLYSGGGQPIAHALRKLWSGMVAPLARPFTTAG